MAVLQDRLAVRIWHQRANFCVTATAFKQAESSALKTPGVTALRLLCCWVCKPDFSQLHIEEAAPQA